MLLHATIPLPLPQCIWIPLHCCIGTVNTLKLVLPLLPTLSCLPPLQFFFPLLFCCLLLASLLPQLLPLRITLLHHPRTLLALLLNLSVNPLLKVTKWGRGVQNNQLLHNSHTRFHITSKILNKKYKFNSHHQPNADLTRYGVQGIIFTHPIPLVVCFLFLRLCYSARITAKAH